MKTFSIDYGWLFLLGSAAFVLLIGLGWSPLFLYDESLYCGATADMAAHGQWLFPTDQGEFFGWYGKPPLINWFQKLSTTIFGWSIWSLRLPTALGMLALIGLIAKTGVCLAGRTTGLTAGGLVMLSARMVHTGRHILLEDLVAPLFAAALLFWATAVGRYERGGVLKWMPLVGAGVCIAAAILTKQAFALFAPFGILVAEAALRRPGWLVRLSVVGAVSLLGAGWWFFAAYDAVGQPFVDSLFGYHIQARFTEALEGHERGLNDYVLSLDDHLQVVPWSFGLLGWLMLWPKLKCDTQRALYISWSALCVVEYFVVGVIVRTFLPWYQLVTMPPLFVGAAYAVFSLWRLESPLRWTGPLLVGAAALVSARIDAFPTLLVVTMVVWRVQHWVVRAEWSSKQTEIAMLGGVALLGLIVANPFHGRDGRFRIAERVEQEESVTVVGDEWRRVWMCYAPHAELEEWDGKCPALPKDGWLILDGQASSCQYDSKPIFSGNTRQGRVALYRSAPRANSR